MRRHTTLAICGVLAAFSMAIPARAGEDFVAGDPEYFFCKSFELDRTEGESDAEGNKQSLTIFVTGICAPRKGGALSGSWKHVTAEGHYDYATGNTSEKVTATSDGWVAVQLRTSCTSNPWAHTPACGIPSQMANNTGVKLDGPFPISAHMLPPHLRQALAEWETSLTNQQMLTDWDPMGPAQKEELVIVKPGFSVPGGASFSVELNAADPQPGWVVLLEWARIDKAKDPSIEIGGAWSHDVPANAPTVVPWGQFPKSIPIPGSFTPGEYALRVRVQGHPDNTKTDWRRFWVGEPPKVGSSTGLTANVVLGGGKIKQYSLDQPGEALMFGKGEAMQFDFSKTPRFKGGQTKMMQGELPPGTGPKLPTLPAEGVGGLQTKPGLRLKGPALSVKTIAVVGGWIESGKHVGLSIEVANAGPVAALGTEPIQIQCTVKSGGPCPVPNSTKTVGKPIPVGSSRSFTLISAIAAQPGTYEVKASPTGGGRGSSFQVEIQVKGSQLSPGAPGQQILMPGAKPALPGTREGSTPQPAVKPALPGAGERSTQPELPKITPTPGAAREAPAVRGQQ